MFFMLFSYSADLMIQNIERFNNIRGGLTPGATNVLYTHGQFDPTRSIGVQTTDHPSSPAIIILGKITVFQLLKNLLTPSMLSF